MIHQSKFHNIINTFKKQYINNYINTNISHNAFALTRKKCRCSKEFGCNTNSLNKYFIFYKKIFIIQWWSSEKCVNIRSLGCPNIGHWLFVIVAPMAETKETFSEIKQLILKLHLDKSIRNVSKGTNVPK